MTQKKRFIRNNTSTCNTPHKVINTIVTDVNVTDSLFHNNANNDDDDDDNNGGERLEKMKTNVGAYTHHQKEHGEKFSKRQISRELFVVNQDGSSNQCDKSDNDNNNRVGSNCEHNKGRTHTPTATSSTVAAPSSIGRSGNRRKFFPDSSSMSFAEFDSPRFIEASLTEEGLASTSTPTAASNYSAKINRSIDEMSTPNSSLHFNNTSRSSFGGGGAGGGNSSRKSFDYSGNKNNNSISRRNTSSPMCLADFINTSGASSSGKQGTMMAASSAGKCGEFNLELIKT